MCKEVDILQMEFPTYFVCCMRKSEEFVGEYISYGITACLGGSCILETIEDITLDVKLALDICNLLEKHQVSALHFKDVVCDLISA